MNSLYSTSEAQREAQSDAQREAAFRVLACLVDGVYHNDLTFICNDWYVTSNLAEPLSIDSIKPIILKLIPVGRLDILFAKAQKKPNPKLGLLCEIETKRRLALLSSLIRKINDVWKYNIWAMQAYTIYNCKEIEGLYIIECNPTCNPHHEGSDYLFIYDNIAVEYLHNNKMRVF